ENIEKFCGKRTLNTSSYQTGTSCRVFTTKKKKTTTTTTTTTLAAAAVAAAAAANYVFRVYQRETRRTGRPLLALSRDFPISPCQSRKYDAMNSARICDVILYVDRARKLQPLSRFELTCRTKLAHSLRQSRNYWMHYHSFFLFSFTTFTTL
ncbi:hypothetical protein ALC56_05213, partial [Trachymyrmex septentrionalis]